MSKGDVKECPYSLFPGQTPSVRVCSPTQVSKSQRWRQDKGQDWEWGGGWVVNSGGSSERQHLGNARQLPHMRYPSEEDE